mgnify:CR=1 FL=1
MKAPTIRNPFAAKPLPEQPDIEAAALRSDRFRIEREGDWRRLEQIVRRLERGAFGRLSDEDIADLPVLYRQAASSLAVASSTSTPRRRASASLANARSSLRAARASL